MNDNSTGLEPESIQPEANLAPATLDAPLPADVPATATTTLPPQTEPRPPTRAEMCAALLRALKSVGGWFDWIAGLSLINAVIKLFGGNINFIFGLSITEVIAFLGSQDKAGATGKIIAMVLTIIAAGIYFLFGYFAKRGQSWAFMTGMILYGLDSLIYLVAPGELMSWLSIGFHGYVIYRLSRGMKLCDLLTQYSPLQPRPVQPGYTAPPPPYHPTEKI